MGMGFKATSPGTYFLQPGHTSYTYPNSCHQVGTKYVNILLYRGQAHSSHHTIHSQEHLGFFPEWQGSSEAVQKEWLHLLLGWMVALVGAWFFLLGLQSGSVFEGVQFYFCFQIYFVLTACMYLHHICASCCQRSKRTFDPLELELQAVTSYHVWLLRIKPGSATRTSACNHFPNGSV